MLTPEEIQECERLLLKFPILQKYCLHLMNQEVNATLLHFAEGMEKRYTDPKLLAVAASLRKAAEVETP